MKAILVVDTHKLGECTHCPMHYENQNFKYRCFVDDWIDDTKGKCPLKPMLKSINEEKALDITKVKDHTYLNGVVDGFSICLDEILGDKK